MPLDTSQTNQKISIPSLQILFEEGAASNSLNILHEGAYSLEKKFGDTSLPLLQVSGKNLTPGVISLFGNGRYPCSIKTTQPSVISTYTVTTATIHKSIQSKMSLGVMIARTLLREILELTKKMNAISSLSSGVEQIRDNMSLAYYSMEPSMFKDIEKERYIYSEDEYIPDECLRLVRKNLSTFWESGGKLPETVQRMFFDEDHHELLKKVYPEEIEIEDEEFHFMRKILALDPAIQTPMYEADISILIRICEKFSQSFTAMVDDLDELLTNLHSSMNSLYGADGLIDKFYMVLDLAETGSGDEKPEVIVPLMETVGEKCSRFLLVYRNIFYKEYQGTSPNLNNLISKAKKIAQTLDSSLLDDILPVGGADTTVSVTVDMEALKRDLDNSASKILNFAKIPQDQVKEFTALLAKLKTLKNPFDADNETRKIRKNLIKTYWDVYSSCIQKYITGNHNVPKPVQMMLKYGYFDETLLEPNQVMYLYTAEDTEKGAPNIPIHTGTEWLEQIYNKNFVTSLDELGQTYFDKIKNDYKDMPFKKESDVPANIDTNENRLRYEMNAMYQPNVRLTTGNPGNFLPILTKFHITLPLDKTIVTRKALSDTLNEILQIDYSAFNREVMINNEHIRKEFVQRSIIPDFILVPSIGSKIMMWQDLSVLRGAGSKESPGRIIFPIFILGDLKTMMLEAIAAFRWELCKNILGPEWNNVGVPSITSEYMDYIQFFKKNKDLSIEIKEKIAAEFKRFRTDRDKFVNDYMLWIKYESEGIQRLNRVVRGIFYKHIPFHKDIRDKVSKLPAYADMHNRFTNIRNRQFREFEARYKKYMDAQGRYPALIQENLDFYKI